jgi:hypothetical protein
VQRLEFPNTQNSCATILAISGVFFHKILEINFIFLRKKTSIKIKKPPGWLVLMAKGVK